MMSTLSSARARPNWVTPLLAPVFPSWVTLKMLVLVAVEGHGLAVVAQIRQRRRKVVEGRLRLRKAQLHAAARWRRRRRPAANIRARGLRTTRGGIRRSGPTRPGRHAVREAGGAWDSLLSCQPQPCVLHPVPARSPWRSAAHAAPPASPFASVGPKSL
jgi:hypothetical protein